MANTVVDPDGLRQSADTMDKAKDAAANAGKQAGEARTNAPEAAFGISEQARELAKKWEAAVAARQEQDKRLADDTGELADRLRAAAADYDKNETDSTGKVKDAAGRLLGA